MKIKSLKTTFAIIIAGTFAANQLQGQITAVSGTASNGCSPAAGTAGTDNVSAGCGSGQQTGTYTGTQNTCVGTKAGNSLCSYYADHNNTFIGFRAGFLNGGSASDDGAASSNTYIGSKSGYSNTYGGANTYLGYLSGYTSASANNNICIGYSAGYNNTADANSFLGTNAGYSNTSGGSNALFGYKAGYYNQTGASNSIFGYQAGYGNGSVNSHSNNSFFGYQAGYGITTGNYNTAIGQEALYGNTSGQQNIAVGYRSMYGVSTGQYNAALGMFALYSSTSGTHNNAFGYAALYSNTTSPSNAAFGSYALQDNTSGDGYNSGFGYSALNNNTTGYNNVAVGNIAGTTNTTGYDNTFIGTNADANANNYHNAAAIGKNTLVTANDKMFMGNTSVIGVYCSSGTFGSYSDGRFKNNVAENVKGLTFINKLRPVTYNLDTKRLDDFLIQNMADSTKIVHRQGVDFAPSTAIVHSGFIAQEVEQAAKDVGFTSSIVSAPTNINEPYALSYSEIVVPLVKAVQELSKSIDSLTAISNEQNTINEALRAQISNCCSGSNPQGMRVNNDAVNKTSGSMLDEIVRGADPSINSTDATLLQNIPNPFNQQTNIRYVISTKAQSASVMIFDLQGKLVKTALITNFGNGAVTINGNELNAGMFVYSLVVDGKIIDTKRMILTQ